MTSPKSCLALLCLFLLSCDESSETQISLPELTVADMTVAEENENSTVEVIVNLSKAFTQQALVSYATNDGSAAASFDYKTTNGTLIFEPGETQKNITIEIIGDLLKESEEFFTITFSSGINLSIATKEVTVTITDTDTETNTGFTDEGYSTPLSYTNYNLVWNDEFEGTGLSTDWTYEIGTGSNGWGNNELQYYREENTSVEDGYLIIQARKENFGGRQYTSSRIITENAQEFQYGRIDIRALLPRGQGLWPALWMLGANFRSVGWPKCGEIDIMEMIGGSGRENTVLGTVHWDNAGTKADYGGDYTLSSGTFSSEFHVFTIIWDSQKIEWLVNDISYHTIDITPSELDEFQKEFFFIFNVAVGGNLPGSPDGTTQFPQQMVVDYVRVFQEQ